MRGYNMLQNFNFSILGLVNYQQLIISGPRDGGLEYWRTLGAKTTTQNGEVVAGADVIFLAVKPHILPTAVANIYETLKVPVKGKLFVSILAGVTLEALENV